MLKEFPEHETSEGMSPVSLLDQNFSTLFVDISQNVIQTENPSFYNFVEVSREYNSISLLKSGPEFCNSMPAHIPDVVKDKPNGLATVPLKPALKNSATRGVFSRFPRTFSFRTVGTL